MKAKAKDRRLGRSHRLRGRRPGLQPREHRDAGVRCISRMLPPLVKNVKRKRGFPEFGLTQALHYWLRSSERLHKTPLDWTFSPSWEHKVPDRYQLFMDHGGVVARCAHGVRTVRCFWNIHPTSTPLNNPHKTTPRVPIPHPTALAGIQGIFIFCFDCLSQAPGS